MPLSPHTNVFAGNPLDRAADRRLDADWLAGRLDDPNSSAVAVWNGQLLLGPETQSPRRLALIPASLARGVAGGEEHLLFLGLTPEGEAMFAVDIDGAADPAEGPLRGLGAFGELRANVARMAIEDAAISATAKAVFEWRRRHRYCSNCGQPSEVAEAGWKRICPACKGEHFPRTDPVVIMLPACGDRCLLGRAARFPPGWYSCLAGFMEPGESIEEACARELMEESGLKALSVRYHSAQPWPYPSSLMIGLIAEVAEGEATPDETELESVRWFTRAETLALLAGELEGLGCPPPFAVAHQLITAWAEGG